MTPEHAAYIDEVETEAAYRRRGFAQALMSRMLWDAAAAGATESILSATPMGKPLYQKLGYTEQAIILVLTKHEKEPAEQQHPPELQQSSRTGSADVLHPALGTIEKRPNNLPMSSKGAGLCSGSSVERICFVVPRRIMPCSVSPVQAANRSQGRKAILQRYDATAYKRLIPQA